MKTLDEIQNYCKSVDGFLSQNGHSLREGEVLFYLAKATPPDGVIVEIGSWKGKSTVWLGKGSDAGPKSKIIAIDPHTGSPEHCQNNQEVWTYPDFENNISLAGLGHLVCPLIKNSHEAAKDVDVPIDLLFIDGAHDEKSVQEDFDLWFPKVKIGGVIAFHDSFLGWPGVRKVVHKHLFKSIHFKNVRYINSISFGIKTNTPSSLTNKLSYLIKRTHEKSLSLPQPFKSIIKKIIWKPFQTHWFKDLNKSN